MGSKLPTDLFPSPDGESQNLSLGGEGRQLRSRLVELCTLCQKPLPATAGKSFASHIHCTCVTPPNAATAPEFTASQSPKKKKVDLEMGESSKRQLFQETVVKTELVKSDWRESHSSLAVAVGGPSAADVKSEDESASRKVEVRSRHVCSICSKCFNTPGKLNQHMFSHTGEKPFVCSHCSKAFSSKFKLVRHILIHSDLRQYRCTVCDRTFHRKDHLKNHSKVHSPVKRRFKCDRAECCKEYSSILSYRKHMAVHSAEEGNLECKICTKRFETKDETLFHLKVHAGSRSLKTPADRKYHCDHCDRSFFTSKDVRRHLVVHTGRRDFLCQYCPQRFGRKDHLTRHIKKSHSTSSKKTRTKKPAETERSKTIGHILQEMMEEKSQTVEQPGIPETASDDLYKMQGLDSPVDVMKLESSPDILPIVTIDDKTPLAQKVDENLGIYDLPMLATDIPFNKYEHYQFENFPIPGPSTSHSIMPELMYQQPPPPPPPPPPPYELDFDPVGSSEVKVESEYPATGQSSTMDLVLPPITNISPSMGNVLLSNADLQNLLSSGQSTTTEDSTTSDNETRNITDQLLIRLPTPNEWIASLLAAPDPQTNSAPLPGFSQAFHQPP